MAEQFTLNLPVTASLAAEDFIVTPCNASAARLIDAWPDWPGRACVLCGSEGSGKTHLAQIWSAKSGAPLIRAGDVGPAVQRGPLAVEGVGDGPLDERAFFHLLNMARETGFDLLLTARTPPGEWVVALPDLRSRFRSLTLVEIGAPDDDLLRMLLVKHFADRQLAVSAEVIEYLLKRMERSAAAAARSVAQLDAAALAQGRRVTRAFAVEVLGEGYES